MSSERRPPSPTVYGERRHSDAGVTSVVLSVQAVAGNVTLVGGDGVAAGRALVPELLGLSNLVLRNPPDAIALEVIGCVTVTPQGSQLGVAVDDDGAITMSHSNHLTVSSETRKRVRYLAIAGGILPGVGVHGPGHSVIVGDCLRPGSLRGALVGGPGRIDLRGEEPIRVRPGPDAARYPAGAFETLCRSRCTMLPGTDRVVSRLSSDAAAALGPATGSGTAATIERGALSVAPDGTLLVTGPDHPAMGAHPVLAVVDAADVGRLAARPEGAAVTFVASR